MSDNNSPFKHYLGYFFKGLIVAVPLALTVYVLIEAFVFLDGLIPMKVQMPGMGLLLFVAAITALGYLATTVIAEPIVNYSNHLLNKVPLVKTLYTSIKDLMSAFVGDKKSFNEPVLVNVGNDGKLQKLGFITQKDLTQIGMPDTKVAVYLPHSYNFSGNLFIVNSDAVTPIEAKAADVMKFIVSGGVTKLDEPKPTKP